MRLLVKTVTSSLLLLHHHCWGNIGQQGTSSGTGADESHLALSLGCKGGDRTVPSQMTRPIITDHRLLAALRFVTPIITTFVELPNPFPYHSITHDSFTVYCTYLTMDISRFHISCFQKTDYRLYFTVGRVLDYLEHFKHTEQYVNTLLVSYWHLWLTNEWRKTACLPKIITSVLQWKYSQIILTFWIRFLHWGRRMLVIM